MKFKCVTPIIIALSQIIVNRLAWFSGKVCYSEGSRSETDRRITVREGSGEIKNRMMILERVWKLVSVP